MQLPLSLDSAPLPSWKCIVCGFDTVSPQKMLAHVRNECGPMVSPEHYEAARAEYLRPKRSKVSVALGDVMAPVGRAASESDQSGADKAEPTWTSTSRPGSAHAPGFE